MHPAFYTRIVPPWLPAPALLVQISGCCEILGGAGMLIPRLRRPAGIGLIALLIAVFPANVQMACASPAVRGYRKRTALLSQASAPARARRVGLVDVALSAILKCKRRSDGAPFEGTGPEPLVFLFRRAKVDQNAGSSSDHV